jgi:hypothetical protein
MFSQDRQDPATGDVLQEEPTERAARRRTTAVRLCRGPVARRRAPIAEAEPTWEAATAAFFTKVSQRVD